MWNVPAHPGIPLNTMSWLFLFSLCANSAVVGEGGASEISTHNDSVGVGSSLFASPDILHSPQLAPVLQGRAVTCCLGGLPCPLASGCIHGAADWGGGGPWGQPIHSCHLADRGLCGSPGSHSRSGGPLVSLTVFFWVPIALSSYSFRLRALHIPQLSSLNPAMTDK